MTIDLHAPESDQWNLFASSARERLSGRFLRQEEDGGSLLILSTICISGQFWIPRPFADPRTSNDVSEAFSVILPQIILRKSLVENLIIELTKWLVIPREFYLNLSGNTHQIFTICFEVTDKLISSIEKPACTITYAGGTFKVGKWSFIVDQSCVRTLREELTAAMQAI